MSEITESEIKDLIGSTIASNKYKLTEYVASGSFSAIFKVKELYCDEEMVAKLERSSPTRAPLLSREFRNYQILRYQCGHKCIPRTYFFGEFGNYYALIMQLLGPPLLNKYEECSRHFSFRTVTLLAIQMIDIFRYIHNRRIVYRDVKPENFLLGLPNTDSENTLHLIDFGLAKEYIDIEGVHIPYIEEAGVTGTLRYMSINANLGREQSRRDDMEAIGHVLIYFLRGSMPWSGLKVRSNLVVAKTAEIKINTSPETLTTGLPTEFCTYLKTVRALQFEEEPNYTQLTELFQKLITNEEQKTIDWKDSKTPENNCSNSNNLPKTT